MPVELISYRKLMEAGRARRSKGASGAKRGGYGRGQGGGSAGGSDSDEDDLNLDELASILEAIQNSEKSESDAVLQHAKHNEERFARAMQMLAQARERSRGHRRPKSDTTDSSHQRGADESQTDRVDPETVVDSDGVIDEIEDEGIGITSDSDDDDRRSGDDAGVSEGSGNVQLSLFVAAMRRSEVHLVNRYLAPIPPRGSAPSLPVYVTKMDIVAMMQTLVSDLMMRVNVSDPDYVDRQLNGLKLYLRAWATDEPGEDEYTIQNERERMRIMDSPEEPVQVDNETDRPDEDEDAIQNERERMRIMDGSEELVPVDNETDGPESEHANDDSDYQAVRRPAQPRATPDMAESRPYRRAAGRGMRPHRKRKDHR